MSKNCKPKRPKFKPLPSYERVRELFHYEPLTGVLTWRVSTNSRVRPGDVVGCINKNGHWVGHIDGQVYVLHRIIWLWMTGGPPLDEVDHRDTDGSNNRWRNLREATSSQNRGNSSLSHRNISGCKGVTWSKSCNKWHVKITKGGKQEYLGLFVALDEAKAAYMKRATELFGEFARAA